jgi:hypothetical protein
MTRIVAYSVMLLSALGTIVCFVFLVVGFGDVLLEKRAVLGLFYGAALVWVPTTLMMQRLVPDLRERLLFKGVLRGCPRPMRIGLRVFLVFVFCASLILTFRGDTPGGAPGGFVIGLTGFYSISFCVMFSSLRAEGFEADRRVPR